MVQRSIIPLLLLLAVLLSGPPRADALERRRPQFQNEPSYLIFPLPYSLPGIGQGIMLTGLLGNMFGTYADLYGLLATGDATGTIIGLEDVHLVSERLIANVFYQDISHAVVSQYETRGLDSKADEFILLEASAVLTLEGSLTAVFFDRRLELVAGTVKQHAEIPRIRDKDGDVIAEADPAFEQDLRSHYYGARWDYTDDYADPRQGVRASLFRSNTDNDGNSQEAEYYVWDFNLSGYVPLGKQSTLALGYFRSDAEVTRRGNTDTLALLQEVGVLCALADAACIEARDNVVDRLRNERTHGTSSTLGGSARLRAYPQGRFAGAHAVLYSAELRWNVTEEVTPFDYFIWKDVRTAIQLAFFAEMGSVSETLGALGDAYRSDVGVGLRLVSASGFVYRADWASGDEGNEVTIIFNYPF